MTRADLAFARLTYLEAEAAAKRDVVLILPVGAVEPHGPHLPLDTDLIIAGGMAEMAADLCRQAGIEAYVLNPLAYAVTDFARGFGGAVSIARDTASALVAEVCRALVGQGFRRIVLANAHLEPAHLDSLRAAVTRVKEATGVEVLFPDITSRRWGRMLTDEFRSGACHAGSFETSLVMACAPEAVRETERRSLPPNPVSLSRKIKEGVTGFKEAGGERAYFGAPADASREEGLATLRTLAGILLTSIQEGRSE